MEIFRFILGCIPLLCIINGQQQPGTSSFASSVVLSDESTGQSSSRGNYVTTTTSVDLQPSSTTAVVNQSLQSQSISNTSSTFTSEQSEVTTNNGPTGTFSDALSQHSSTPALQNTNVNIITSIDGHSDVSSTVVSTVHIAPSQSLQDSTPVSGEVDASVQTTEALVEQVSSSTDDSITPSSSSYVQDEVTTSLTDEGANVIQSSSSSAQYTSTLDSVQPSDDISSDLWTSSVLEGDSLTTELSESPTQSAQFQISSASLNNLPSSSVTDIIDVSSSSVQEIVDASSSVQEIIDASSSVQEIIDTSLSSVQEFIDASSSDQVIIFEPSSVSTQEYRSDVSSSISRSDDTTATSSSTAPDLESSSDVYFSTTILDTFTQETSSRGGPHEASSSVNVILGTSRVDSVSSDAFQSAFPSISQATYQTQIPATVTSSSMQSVDLVSESSSVVPTSERLSSESTVIFSEQTISDTTEVLPSQSADTLLPESTTFAESSAQSKESPGHSVEEFLSVSASDFILSSDILATNPSQSMVGSMVTSVSVQTGMISSTSISDSYFQGSASEVFSSSDHDSSSSDLYSGIQLDSSTSSTEQIAFSESSGYSGPLSSVGSEFIRSSEVSSTWLTSSETLESASTPFLPDQASEDLTETVSKIIESQTSLGIYVTESPSESFLIESTSVLSLYSESSSFKPSTTFQPSYSESVASSQEDSASFEAYETDTIFTYTLSVTGSTSSKLTDSSLGSSDYFLGSEMYSTVSTGYSEGASETPAFDSSSYQSETLAVEESIIFPISESSEVITSSDLSKSVYESIYTEFESSSTSNFLESTSLGSSLIYGSESGFSESLKVTSESTFLLYPTSELSSEMSESLTIETVLYPPLTTGTILSSELMSESFATDTTAIVIPSEETSVGSEFLPTATESYLESISSISISDALLPALSSTSGSVPIDSSLSSIEDSYLTTIDSSTYGPTYPVGTESGIQSSTLDLSAPSIHDMSSEVYGSSSIPLEVNSSVVDITFPSSVTFSQTLLASDSAVVSLSSSLVLYPNSSTRDVYFPTDSSTDHSLIFVSETMTSIDSESSYFIIPLPTSLTFETSSSLSEFDLLTSSLSEPITIPSLSPTTPEGSSFYPLPSFSTTESSYTVTEQTSYGSSPEFYPQTSGDTSSLDFSDVTSLELSSLSETDIPVLPTFELSSSDFRSTSSSFESVFESRTSYFTELSSLPDMTSFQTAPTSAIFDSSESIFDSSFAPIQSTEVISSSELTLPSFDSESVFLSDVMSGFVSGTLSTETSAIVPIFPSSEEFSSSTESAFPSSEEFLSSTESAFPSSEEFSSSIESAFPSSEEFLFSTESAVIVPSLSSSESMSEMTISVQTISSYKSDVVPSVMTVSDSPSSEFSDFVPSFASTESLSTESSTFVPSFEFSSASMLSDITDVVPSFAYSSESLSSEISDIVPSFAFSSETKSTGISEIVPSFTFSSETKSTDISEIVPSFTFSSETKSTDISEIVPSFTFSSESFSTDFVPSFQSTESSETESTTIVPSFALSSEAFSSEMTENETLLTGISEIVSTFAFSSEISATGISFTSTFVSNEINSTELSTFLQSFSSVFVPSLASSESFQTEILNSTMTESVSTEASVIVPSFPTSIDISSETSVMQPSMSTEPMTTGMPNMSFPTESFTSLDTSSGAPSIPIQTETVSSSEISAVPSIPMQTESVLSSEISGFPSIPIQTESISSSETSATQSPQDTTSSIVETMTLPDSSSMESTSVLLPTPTEAPMSSEVSSSMTSSITSTVTTSPPPTTTATINTGDDDFWVITVIKVRRSEDVTTERFKTNIQTKLASVYEEAFVREALIKNGTYEPLKRRKKRFATSPDGTLKMEVLNIERQSGSSNTDVTYLAEKDGALVPADKMVDTLGLLDDQEVALGLGYVVSTKAEPYVPVPVTPPAEDRKLWIIAAVLGPLVGLLILWILVCVCCKYYCSLKGVRNSEEPHLMKVRRDGGAHVENQFEASENPPDYPPEEGSHRSNGVGLVKTSTKKMSYEVNPDPDDDSPLYAEVKKPVDAGRIPKKKHPSPSHQSGAADQVSYVSEDDNTSKRRARKKKQTHKDDDSSPQIENMVEPYHHEPRSKPLPVPRAVKPHHDEPASHEDEEELMERAEMERLKNKQRLREQRKKEKLNNSGSSRGEGGYRKAQREIDAVLGDPDKESLPDVFVNKPKKRSTRRKKDHEGHNNEAYTEDEQEASSTTGESLEEAKQRMHRLLDDAFSLISSSRSSIGNKVTPMSSPKKKDSRHSHPTSNRSDESDRTPRSHKSDRKSSTESKPQEEEKKHTPMFYNPAYSGHEDGGLETWSPYRAADEVALISLPQTQTVLDKTPTQEPLQTTTFNESYPTSMRDSYYTTEPAKPIVIRTKDMDTHDMSSFKPPPKHQTVNGIGAVSGNLPNGDATYPGMKGYEEIPLHSVGNKLNHSGHRENGDVPHQAPIKTWAGQDEVDIVTSLETGSSPRPFIRSLREELEHLSTKVGDYPQTDSKGNA